MESLDLLSEASESTYPQSMERLVGERAASLRRKGKLPEKSYFGTNRISDKDKKVLRRKRFLSVGETGRLSSVLGQMASFA